MFADNVMIKINGTSYKGTSALIDELKSIIQKVPDVTHHLVKETEEPLPTK